MKRTAIRGLKAMERTVALKLGNTHLAFAFFTKSKSLEEEAAILVSMLLQATPASSVFPDPSNAYFSTVDKQESVLP